MNGGWTMSKVAFVTGGSSGIGQAVVRSLAEDGYDVIIGYHNDKEGAEKANVLAKKLSVKTLIVGGDLSDENVVIQTFGKIKDNFKRLDVLVNVAGGVPGKEGKSSYDHWLNVFNANLFSTTLCCEAAAELMNKQESIGKIVNIASVLGEDYGGRAGAIEYAAAKAAVINYTQTLAKQLVPKILVNAVSPGRTHTPYYDKMDEEKRETLKSANRIGRFVEPREIAQMVIAVINNDAIAGETVSVNGGFFLWER
jgi:NAD(P)-dependent dehydrogenase (short-subunit alcohol dehydrogenase family)